MSQQIKTDSEQTNFGFQSVDKTEKAKLVAAVFDSVANKYDLMNDIMSLGLHRWWKKFTLLSAKIQLGDKILDLAGGTGDMSLGFAPLVGDQGQIWHSDINATMLKIAQDRFIDQGMIIPQCLSDAEQLAFKDNYFDHIVVAFGLRNMTNKEKALKEMYRVLRYGGSLMILEFSQIHPLLTKVYEFYSFKILPWMGELIAQDKASYQYLAESIRLHPNQESLKQMIINAGFDQVKYYNLTLGISALHQAYKI